MLPDFHLWEWSSPSVSRSCGREIKWTETIMSSNDQLGFSLMTGLLASKLWRQLPTGFFLSFFLPIDSIVLEGPELLVLQYVRMFLHMLSVTHYVPPERKNHMWPLLEKYK